MSDLVYSLLFFSHFVALCRRTAQCQIEQEAQRWITNTNSIASRTCFPHKINEIINIVSIININPVAAPIMDKVACSSFINIVCTIDPHFLNCFSLQTQISMNLKYSQSQTFTPGGKSLKSWRGPHFSPQFSDSSSSSSYSLYFQSFTFKFFLSDLY